MSKPIYPNSKTIAEHTFSNGLTVLVYENFNAASVVVTGSLRAGSVYEPLTQVGLASMTAAGLLRGTQRRNFDVIHSTLEDIGADLDFSTGKYRVVFEGRALAEDLSTLLDVLADGLRNPLFPDDEVAEERRVRLTELNYAQQNTRFMASRLFREAIYPPTHPYHHFTYGSATSLPHLNADHLRDYHAQQYAPDDMLLVVVGAVEAKTVLKQVDALLGDWQNPRQAPLPTLPKATAPDQLKTVHHTVAGKTQTDLVLGTLGLSRYSDDYLAASLANSILGEFGMMGRVGNIIREQMGLAYYAYTHLEAGQGIGTWHVVAGVSPDNVDLTIKIARDELRRITQEKVSPEELDDNQAYFTGRLPLQLENNSGIANMLHALKRYELGLDYLLHYKDLIYAVTRDDLLTTAQRYLDPDTLVIASAGPML